ncbi:hypothetical protein T02_5946 [Trichinella nativa]|uniref:Uncharacterized protein n=1 Tax=Trichinella nativa TaxID=6335 RepID=A0A0V1KH42_9BILA|nr:hypothetical protein T02_5946 [Trichinella nativa]
MSLSMQFFTCDSHKSHERKIPYRNPDVARSKNSIFSVLFC